MRASEFKRENKFSLEYYERIVESALAREYRFMTMREFVVERPDVHEEKIAVLRHDLDDRPSRLPGIVDVERRLGVRSTIFVLMHTDRYSLFSYNVLSMLRSIDSEGFEVGLHTNFVEVAQIVGCDPDMILTIEAQTLKAYFDVAGVACHRNIDFMYNSLPYLQENWPRLQEALGFLYEAYDEDLFSDLVFVNEGFKPHIDWRNEVPESVIESEKSFCLSTHPHWWHRDHPFED